MIDNKIKKLELSKINDFFKLRLYVLKLIVLSLKKTNHFKYDLFSLKSGNQNNIEENKNYYFDSCLDNHNIERLDYIMIKNNLDKDFLNKEIHLTKYIELNIFEIFFRYILWPFIAIGFYIGNKYLSGYLLIENYPLYIQIIYFIISLSLFMILFFNKNIESDKIILLEIIDYLVKKNNKLKLNKRYISLISIKRSNRFYKRLIKIEVLKG